MIRLHALIVFALLTFAASAHAQIEPYSENPSYWQYDGRPIVLIGASNQDNLFQWAGDGTKLSDHLDLLASCGGNYVRCTMSSRSDTEKGYRWNVYPYPFAKVGNRYDLTRWNDDYWNKLHTFLEETHRRGIIVQLELWDRWNESGNSIRPSGGWYDAPWNPNNNSTYNWSDSPLLKPGRTAFYNAVHAAALTNDPVLLPLQERFVRRILDTVIDGEFDHVLFQIDNESGIGDASLGPDVYWARFAREYAASKGRRNLHVCTQRRFHKPCPYPTTTFRDWENPEIRVPIVNDAFTFCDISQNNGVSGQEHYDNILWYRSKVLEHGARPINHVKSYQFEWPIGGDFHCRRPGTEEEAAARLWRAVFAGAAGLRFHRRTAYDTTGICSGLGLTPVAQAHLKSMRLFLDAIHIFTMERRNNLLMERGENEAYCLTEAGKRYAVYFSGEANRSVVLRVSGAADLRGRWLDVAHSRFSDEELPVTGENLMLRSPGSGQWVAVLTSSATNQSGLKER